MTDRELKEHVQNVVTLRGNVRSYAERSTAEPVASRVYGMKAVAHDHEVRLASDYERIDNAPTWTSPKRL